MRLANCALLIVSLLSGHTLKAQTQFAERRQRAAAAFRDGVVLLHASSQLGLVDDGFRQDPYFYYFTGLENTVGAVLAIDGKSGESWLFLPSNPAHSTYGLQPDVRPGAEDAKRLGIEHVVDWTELGNFLSSRAAPAKVLYYAASWEDFAPEMPGQLLSAKSPNAPLWLQVILQKWPALEPKDATRPIEALMEVQSEREVAAWRNAAKATVAALMAGMKAIRPDASQQCGGRGEPDMLEPGSAWSFVLALGDGRRECGVSASFFFGCAL